MEAEVAGARTQAEMVTAPLVCLVAVAMRKTRQSPAGRQMSCHHTRTNTPTNHILTLTLAHGFRTTNASSPNAQFSCYIAASGLAHDQLSSGDNPAIIRHFQPSMLHSARQIFHRKIFRRKIFKAPSQLCTVQPLLTYSNETRQ